jgi:hypothetical protein
VRIQVGEAVSCDVHIAQESIAHSRHGGDVARLVSVVCEKLAQEGDAAGQRVL